MLFQPIFRPEHLPEWKKPGSFCGLKWYTPWKPLLQILNPLGPLNLLARNLGRKIWSFGGFRVLGSMDLHDSKYWLTARERKIFEGLWKMHKTHALQQWKMKMFIWSSWPPGLESWEIHFNGYFKPIPQQKNEQRWSPKRHLRNRIIIGVPWLSTWISVLVCTWARNWPGIDSQCFSLEVLQWVFVVLKTCVIPNAPPLKAYHYILYICIYHISIYLCSKPEDVFFFGNGQFGPSKIPPQASGVTWAANVQKAELHRLRLSYVQDKLEQVGWGRS